MEGSREHGRVHLGSLKGGDFLTDK